MFKGFMQLMVFMQHSKINSNWGFIGKYILVAPASHRVHHSNNPEHYGKNLGSILIIWDRIFGTYYQPKGEFLTFGIPNNPYNKRNYLYDIFLSTKLFYNSLFQSLKIRSLKNRESGRRHLTNRP
jgi:sterol desaturase/sphingolipid hydroxylase (fatty acid hydroxylase superfamily)